MNIKKALTNVAAVNEILKDLVQDPEEEELLSELDFYLSSLNKSIYEGVK